MAERRRPNVQSTIRVEGNPINSVSKNPDRNLVEVRFRNRQLRDGLGITKPK